LHTDPRRVLDRASFRALRCLTLYRAPREKHAQIGTALWSGASFRDMAKRHVLMIRRYPHNTLGTGKPYEGIETLRPESIETVNTLMFWQLNK